MIGVIKQALRGCGTLPHVGEHPGTGFVALLILAGGAAGWRGGILGILMGAGFMAAGMVPIYLCGAYSRAQLSDRLAAQGIEARQGGDSEASSIGDESPAGEAGVPNG